MWNKMPEMVVETRYLKATWICKRVMEVWMAQAWENGASLFGQFWSACTTWGEEPASVLYGSMTHSLADFVQS